MMQALNSSQPAVPTVTGCQLPAHSHHALATALPQRCSIKTAPSDIVTGIPVPNVTEAAAPTPTPAPTPGSGAAGMTAGSSLLAAALAAVLMLV